MSKLPMLDNTTYRVPTELAINKTEVRRVLLIGSCLAIHWPEYIYLSEQKCHCDYVVYNNAAMLPEIPPNPVSDYDFQILQMPLRTLIPDGAFSRLVYNDLSSYQKLFEDVCGRMSLLLHEAMRWNRAHGILTFVTNFLVSQQSNVGRLLPRYDIRNFQFFVQKLNEELERQLRDYENSYIVDVDSISATIGRRYLQDDVAWADNHAAFLSDFDFEADQDRIVPLKRMSEIYPISQKAESFLDAFWAEILGMFRTIRSIDVVKLVIFDLDDTLWRGVMAEQGDISGIKMEGWPLGVVDALLSLKRRGILLAIASKNDHDFIESQWDNTFGKRILFSDFASVKINRDNKVSNISDILSEVNILPKNAVFVDDNPAERGSVGQAFEGLRTLEANPYTLKRILQWSPETQVAHISDESARRTEMVQGQILRETVRAKMSREEFLESLQIRVEFDEIWSSQHPRYKRSLELVNKTNQFNTTGKRWIDEEAAAALESGTVFLTWSVEDAYTHYGLVGVAVVVDDLISQMVMSCRVFGLDIEYAVVSRLVQRAQRINKDKIRANIIKTSVNSACHDVFENMGFVHNGQELELQVDRGISMPQHIRIV